MRSILSLILAITTLGCGSDPSLGSANALCANSPIVGEWTHQDNSEVKLTLTAQCVYQTQPCGTTGSFPPVTATGGQVLVTVEAAGTGGNCLPVGVTQCGYTMPDSDTLVIDCGAGMSFYSR